MTDAESPGRYLVVAAEQPAEVRGVGIAELHGNVGDRTQGIEQADTGDLGPALLVKFHRTLSCLSNKQPAQMRGLDRGASGENFRTERLPILNDGFDTMQGLPDFGSRPLFLEFHIGTDQCQDFFKCRAQIELGDDRVFDRDDQILTFPLDGIGKGGSQVQMFRRFQFLPLVKQGGPEEHAKLGVFPIILEIMEDPLGEIKQIVQFQPVRNLNRMNLAGSRHQQGAAADFLALIARQMPTASPHAKTDLMVGMVMGADDFVPLQQSPDGNRMPGGNSDIISRDRVFGFHWARRFRSTFGRFLSSHNSFSRARIVQPIVNPSMITIQNKKRKTGTGWICAFAVVCSSLPLPAGQVTWTGGGPDANWSAAGNWSTGSAPVPGGAGDGNEVVDSLVFEGTTQQENINDLTFGYYKDIVFQNGGFTLSGSSPGVSGNITSSGNNTISSGLVLGGAGARFVNTAAGGTLTIGKNINFQNGTLQDNSFGTTVYNATFIRDGTFNIFSFGQSILGGDNSAYGGKIQIYRYAKLTNEKGLGGPSTTVILDRSFAPASVDLNGLDVAGVNVSFTALQKSSSDQIARLRNTSTTPASFGGDIHLIVTGGVDGAGELALNGNISGAGGFAKMDPGMLTLAGSNSYTGQTSVSGGTLVINGSIESNAVEVKSGAKLGGVGKIGGPVMLDLGSFFAPGSNKAEQGVLTITNTLHLGGTTEMALNRTNAKNAGRIAGVTTLTFGGILSVANAGPALQANDTFPLFRAQRFEGNFSAMNLPALSPGLGWDWNAAKGILSVRRLPVALPGKTIPALSGTTSVPTRMEVAYGPHPQQVLYFWKARSDKPTPLLFEIHGGGWISGTRMSGLSELLAPMLDAGISVVSVEYRFIAEAMHDGVTPPVKEPLDDVALALKFVRSKAAEWNIDKTRIAASGSSAGGCSALWLAFHDDLADASSANPVARESTRLRCAAVTNAQTSLDPQQMREWIPNSDYGGHAFGILKKSVEDPPVAEPGRFNMDFDSFLAQRERLLPWIQEFSPYALVSADDPPVYLFYTEPPAPGEKQKDPTHSANFGVKLQEKMKSAGLDCELVFPGAVGVKHATVPEYLIETLKSPNVP